MPTHTIELSDHDDTVLRYAVESGRHASISGAIEDALSLLEAEDQTSDEEKLKRVNGTSGQGWPHATTAYPSGDHRYP